MNGRVRMLQQCILQLYGLCKPVAVIHPKNVQKTQLGLMNIEDNDNNFLNQRSVITEVQQAEALSQLRISTPQACWSITIERACANEFSVGRMLVI